MPFLFLTTWRFTRHLTSNRRFDRSALCRTYLKWRQQSWTSSGSVDWQLWTPYVRNSYCLFDCPTGHPRFWISRGEKGRLDSGVTLKDHIWGFEAGLGRTTEIQTVSRGVTTRLDLAGSTVQGGWKAGWSPGDQQPHKDSTYIDLGP